MSRKEIRAHITQFGMVKICSTCKELLPEFCFGMNRSMADGLQTVCKKCKKIYYQQNKSKIATQKKAYHATDHGAFIHQTNVMFQSCKRRTAKYGLSPVTINHGLIRERMKSNRCELTGLAFSHGNGVFCGASATIDRIDPEGAYSPDNVKFIAHRLNNIKQNRKGYDCIKGLVSDIKKAGKWPSDWLPKAT